MLPETGKKDQIVINTNTDTYNEKLEKQKSLFKAAESGDYEKISYFLSLGVNVDAQDYRRENYHSLKHAVTPLHIAVTNGHLKCVQMLIDHGANLDAKDENNCTALHVAAEKGNYLCLKALLLAGADCCLPISCVPSCRIISSYLKGVTALHLAAANNHVNCVEELINFGADYNAIDENGHTSLYIAAKAGFSECVLAHLRHPHGRNILSIPSYDTSDTPLHFAVKNRMLECVKELLRLGSDANQKNINGHSPLFLVYYGLKREQSVEWEIFKHLVLAGNADINNFLKLTMTYNHEIAKFLLAYRGVLSINRGLRLLKRELKSIIDSDIVKYLVKCMPVLPHLNSFDLLFCSILPCACIKINEVWHGSVLSDNAEFNLDVDETGICIEIYECETKFRYMRNASLLKYKRYPLKDPLTSLVHERVIDELKSLEGIVNYRVGNNMSNFEIGQLLYYRHLVELKKHLWYQQKASNTFTLQHYCRFTIRKCIGSTNLKHIRKLPLPEKLLSYLLFDCDD